MGVGKVKKAIKRKGNGQLVNTQLAIFSWFKEHPNVPINNTFFSVLAVVINSNIPREIYGDDSRKNCVEIPPR